MPPGRPTPMGILPAPAAKQRLFEIRLGAYAHDPISPERGSVDINGEFLIDPFLRDRSTLWGALVPRLHVGTTGNFTNKTSQAYAGFTWTYDITPQIFIEGGLGGAVHNGKVSLPRPAWLQRDGAATGAFTNRARLATG